LESPSPEPVYPLGPESIGPFTCPEILLFIDYTCLLCCFSNRCERTFCMVGAVFQAVPASVRRAGALSGPLWQVSGSRQCQRRPRVISGSPGMAIDTDRRVFSSGVSRGSLAGPCAPKVPQRAPGVAWMWPRGDLRGRLVDPPCPWVALVNPGAPPGVALVYYRGGSAVNDGGPQSLSILRSMGWAAQR